MTTSSTTSTFFFSSPPLSLNPHSHRSLLPFKLKPLSISHSSFLLRTPSRSPHNPFLTRAEDDDGDSAGPDHYEMEEDEMEELDNKKDFDIEYDSLLPVAVAADEDITIVESGSFVSTQGWNSDTVVDYKINEEEFHKISLVDCDFFIRKPPDPDNDVYDFREVRNPTTLPVPPLSFRSRGFQLFIVEYLN